MAKAFYCENCGTRVGSDASVCSGCGRLFRAVKCPRCALQGDKELFRNGCPSCGYLADSKQRRETIRSPKPQETGTGFLGRMSRSVTWLLIGLLLLVLVLLLVLFRYL